MPPPLKLLFVCGRNLRRSPTAERLFRKDPRVSVRSAGVSDSSPRRVGESDLLWADLVLVMERKYAARIRSAFAHLEDLPEIESLEIPDEFEPMDEELVELLRAGVEERIGRR
jgi:protein-tyrosine phosphatase